MKSLRRWRGSCALFLLFAAATTSCVRKQSETPKYKYNWIELETEVSPNVFTCRLARIQVRKPDSWRFAPSEEIKRSREELMTANPKILSGASNVPLPLVQIMKYKIPYTGLNPTVLITVRAHKGMKAYDTLGTVIQAFERQRIASDFRVVSEIEHRNVDGEDAAYAACAWTTETVDGVSVAVIGRICHITNSENLVIVGMTGPASGPDRSDKEFSEILSSLKVVDPLIRGDTETALDHLLDYSLGLICLLIVIIPISYLFLRETNIAGNKCKFLLVCPYCKRQNLVAKSTVMATCRKCRKEFRVPKDIVGET